MSKDLMNKIDALGAQEYMSDAQLAVFEEHLRGEHERLIIRQQEITNTSMKNPESISGDEADKANAIQSSADARAESEKNKAMLRSVSVALQAIKTRDYGYCIKCGEEIGLKRMISQPAACRDIECETFEERKNKQNPAANLKIS
ncbi:MAG: hypothetical protein CMG75_08485 [Candidatus Marinimicrobia bacterium]|nr:hypothetical protein [Candidatus Neomarinimicrobiota bacterium]